VLGEHTVILSGSKALGQVFYNTTLVQRRGALPANVAALLGRDILPAIDNSRHAEVRAIIMQAINTRGVIQAHLNTLDRVMNKCDSFTHTAIFLLLLSALLTRASSFTGTWLAGHVSSLPLTCSRTSRP
jgi:cytochrome P450